MSVHEQIGDIVAQLAASSTSRAPAVIDDPLDKLFERLRDSDDQSSQAEAEDLIWALWCAHEDEAARNLLNYAIGSLSCNEHQEAERLLDELVLGWPDWSEAWNKRATLYFLCGRFVESMQDISRALALEPRHFGAMAGFGQICLQIGDEHSALVAFECALNENPNLDAVRDAAEALWLRLTPKLH